MKNSNMHFFHIYVIWTVFISWESHTAVGGNNSSHDLASENLSFKFVPTPTNKSQISSTTKVLLQTLTTHFRSNSTVQTPKSSSGSTFKLTTTTTTNKPQIYSPTGQFTSVSTGFVPNVTWTSTAESVHKSTTTKYYMPKNFTSENEAVLGGVWDGWKRLLTLNYWKVRAYDNHYLMEVIIPFALGTLVAWIIVIVVFVTRCILHVKRQKTMRSKRMAYYNKGESSDKWMLLEHESTSEDSEQETV